MITHLQDTVTLSNGVKIPGFGLGVYKVEDGDTVIHAVSSALKNGYRHIDTATIYDNEKGVGQAVKESGVPREEIFITSKVWNDDQGYESTLKAFEETLEKLDTEYLDLYLIHWPVSGKYKDTYRALEKLYEEGKVRAIGVSNFHVHHLEDLMNDCTITPMIDQVEFHPHLTQSDLRKFCQENNIQFEAWSPLKKGRLFEDPTLMEIAETHGKTVAQVMLRWDIQHDVVTIPKSIREKRIVENADVFDFTLSEEEMKRIDEMNRDERTGSNPDTF
ncbi:MULTISPECIES: aldo/keto reductase [Allobacillus]|uniref:Aldo/keto reductase n=1 Tax=Allobacillus salarius TaxID=1955272 RepID=A0A556PPA5_9BACI|nr:aldo/keto reductase [Allobacillus salarius]TSJ66227.1 aldo/keto reductase [Allobacillus salarius]